MQTLPIPPGLYRLRQHYQDNGFDLRLVGGCVRDWLRGGGKMHDIDLCTDANPEEQRALYQTYGVRWIGTGQQHGTWSVVIDRERYEISSLRSAQTGTDGPCYSRDWSADLARRDFTINAIAMSFEGDIFDPQQGRADLDAGIVRFVGDAAQRIREDPLRILRWFRFHTTIAKGRFAVADVLTTAAIRCHRDRLATVSRERVWAELRPILGDAHGLVTLLQIILYGVAAAIDLAVPTIDDPVVAFTRLQQAHGHSRDPVSLLAAYLGTPDHLDRLATAWRWSVAERRQGRLIAGYVEAGLPDPEATAKRQIALAAVPARWMAETLRVMGWPALALEIAPWQAVFPVSGADLLAGGRQPGPCIGQTLRRLQQAWADSNYTLTRHDLLAIL